MPIQRKMLTNFSKGELSPLLEGRPDLASYFEGCRTLENFYILRQAGVSRRPGTRFVAETKNSAKDSILLPFTANVEHSFILEVGDEYIRFYQNKAQIESSPGVPLEISSPYDESIIRELHFTQSVDVMYIFHPLVAQRKLSRVSDTSWVLSQIVWNPPPSVEVDTNVAAGATLTPGATTGNGITFTASSDAFLAGDIHRIIVYGGARANITAVTDARHVITDIIDAFPNTSPIPAADWFLRLSPQATLDPSITKPEGAYVVLTANINCFRSADLTKFISIYGGLIQILAVDTPTSIRGVIWSVLDDVKDIDDPDPAPAGSWSLEEASWTSASGFPRTGDFVEGRLTQAATFDEPNVIWMSASDDYVRYAKGVKASDSVTVALATRQLNLITWLIDASNFFVGTEGTEHIIKSGKQDAPIGGDQLPLPIRISNHGSQGIQPIVLGSRVLFVDQSAKQIWSLVYDLQQDSYDPVEVTGPAEHITESGIRLGPCAFTTSPHPRGYWIREDGTLVALTYFYQEKVIGFSRLVTDGVFESVGVRSRLGKSQEVWVVVKRIINGQTKRFVEVFDTDAAELQDREWPELQTDCAKIYDLGGIETTTFTGLGHLEGKMVDVIADGVFIGQKQVISGIVTLDSPATQHVEIGLHYKSTLKTLRPAAPDIMTEGLPRQWRNIGIRLYKSYGGMVNGAWIPYLLGFSAPALFTGDKNITVEDNWDTEGILTIEQDQPYPLTVLALYGEIVYGDKI